jgi:RND family efflux transporter MFP subunit
MMTLDGAGGVCPATGGAENSPMAGRRLIGNKLWRWLRKAVVFLALAAMVVLLLLWLIGALGAKIPPQVLPPPTAKLIHRPLFTAHDVWLPIRVTAVGTVRAIQPAVLAPRIIGRVVFCALYAGGHVTRGQVLVRLANTELRDRLHQAAAAENMARAQLHQVEINQRRTAKLFATGDMTQAALDQANTNLASARAGLARAAAVRQRAATVLGYAVIRAPLTGLVMDKHVNVGDTVLPGQALATLYDPRRMQLEAVVRESLVGHLRLGQKLPVQLEGFHHLFAAHIRQIVPRVNVQSRSFIVKVAADFPPTAYPGMFGRLVIPVRRQRILVIPQAAIESIGQLDMVKLLQHGRLIRQSVQPGRHIGPLREILSGLVAGDRVAMPVPLPIRVPTGPEKNTP